MFKIYAIQNFTIIDRFNDLLGQPKTIENFPHSRHVVVLQSEKK
jgi:hypothetical protein